MLIYNSKIEKEIAVDSYYTLRAIKKTSKKPYQVVDEREFTSTPDGQDIAQFLYDNRGKADFCSMVRNFRLADYTIPFADEDYEPAEDDLDFLESSEDT